MDGAERAARAAVGAAVAATAVVETGKAGGLSGFVKVGLCIVKAHPVVFGFVAAVAVVTVATVIVHKIIKSKEKKSKSKEKKLKYSSKNDSTTEHHENMYYYDPETKTITNDSAAPVSNDLDRNLKKRNVAQSAPSTNNNISEKSTDKKNIVTVAKEVQTDPVDLIEINQNINECKVLPDKNIMSLEEKVNEYFYRNASAVDAVINSETDTMSCSEQEAHSELSDSSNWSNISSAKSSDNSGKRKYKDYKRKVHRSLKKYVEKMVQDNCDSLSTDNSDTSSSVSSSSNWSNISSEKSTDDFEKVYKKKMHRTLQKFVNNMNKTETSRTPSECSSTSIGSSSNGSVLSEEPEVCIACTQNPVNTHAQPCNHRYLCSDCAMKFFKLYKKCKICRIKIERVVVED